MLRRQVISSLSALFLASGSMTARSVALPIDANVPRPSVNPSLPVEPAPINLEATATGRAQEWLQRVRTGVIDRSLLKPELSSMLSDEAIKTGAELVARLGPPVNMFPFQRRYAADYVADYYRVRFATATLTWILSVSPDSLVNGFALRRSSKDKIVSATLRSL